jgi:hypothetical protein
MPVNDVRKGVHELQVHQIELELQDDELHRTQLELEQARDRYADLYDFAPAACLTLNADGEILEANLNAGELLGLKRRSLIHQKFSRFVLAGAQDTFDLFANGDEVGWDTALTRGSTPPPGNSAGGDGEAAAHGLPGGAGDSRRQGGGQSNKTTQPQRAGMKCKQSRNKD